MKNSPAVSLLVFNPVMPEVIPTTVWHPNAHKILWKTYTSTQSSTIW